MGQLTEASVGRNLAAKLDKMRDEQNERLDRLIVAQDRTNQLLEWVGGLLQPKVNV